MKMKSRVLPKASLKIGLVQMNSGEDILANVQAALVACQKLKSEKCDLICLPENALFLRIDKSKKIVGMNLKESFWREFCEFATANNCHIIVGSVPFQTGRKLTNSMVLVAPQRRPKVIYDKIHLFDVDVAGAPASRESDNFMPGKKPKMLLLNGWNIGLSICYDIRFSELYNFYAKKNAHLILVPAAFLVPTGLAHWHTLLRARAIECQAYVVAPAQSGEHRSENSGDSGLTRHTFGHSLIVGPWGDVLGECSSPGAGNIAETMVVELKAASLKQVSEQIPMANHRRL